VFELSNVLSRKTQEVSKGELQRIIMAFSLLYGSKSVIMDEPVFALEDYQKEKAMEYLVDYSRKSGMSLLFCAHELNLCEKYSDNMCIFMRDKNPLVGKTKDVFTQENIEAAYNVPLAMLKHKENLHRDILEN
jgi:ABC-type cobalamin/Fe3+-siderophores transport system ATPase subunit